jgi:hypothetical protein
MQPPPGYPFVGPLRSRPPPPPGDPEVEAARSLGIIGFVLVFASVMMGAGFLLVALLVGQMKTVQAEHATAGAPSDGVQLAPEPAAASAVDVDPSRRVVDSPPAPPTVRNVPTHPARFLEGCSASDLDAIDESLTASIGLGAPLFNEGEVTACADEYDHAATKLEGLLAPSCTGPLGALGEGKATAGRLGEPNARAWAMRDAFDGLLEVVERSRSGGVGNL